MKICLRTTIALLVGLMFVFSACTSPMATSEPSNVSTTTQPLVPVPVTLTVDANSPITSTSEKRENPLEVIETDLEISHAPKLNEPATLNVTINSPVKSFGMEKYTAYISLSRKAYELLDGNLTFPVSFKAGEPVNFSAVVAFRETGYWEVSAQVWGLWIPGSGPLGMYYMSPIDIISLNIGVDESTLISLP